MTPAIASEPYCAAAPSRSTSMLWIADRGIALMSVPAEPRPMVCCTFTSACWWRRLPLIRTSSWSGPRPRRVAGRMMSVPSLMKVVLKLKDGSRSCSTLPSSCIPVDCMSFRFTRPTGTAVSSAVLAWVREPSTITWAVGSASWASAGAKAAMIAEASSARRKCCFFIIVRPLSLLRRQLCLCVICNDNSS